MDKAMVTVGEILGEMGSEIQIKMLQKSVGL